MSENWARWGNCRESSLDELFVTGAAQNKAKKICIGCPVQVKCLAEALDNGIEYGVWGGLTERERRALRRRYPTVANWSQLIKPKAAATKSRPAAPANAVS